MVKISKRKCLTRRKDRRRLYRDQKLKESLGGNQQSSSPTNRPSEMTEAPTSIQLSPLIAKCKRHIRSIRSKKLFKVPFPIQQEWDGFPEQLDFQSSTWTPPLIGSNRAEETSTSSGDDSVYILENAERRNSEETIHPEIPDTDLYDETDPEEMHPHQPLQNVIHPTNTSAELTQVSKGTTEESMYVLLVPDHIIQVQEDH